VRLSKLGVCLAVAACSLVACAEEPGSLRIDASASTDSLLTALVAEYRARHPRDTIVLMEGLSGGGDPIVGVATGIVDVAGVALEMNETQLHAAGLSAHRFARIGMLFGVNARMTVSDITRVQLCEMYSGTIANWRELGGPDLPIKAGIPMPRSGEGSALEPLRCPGGFRYGAHVQAIDALSMANAIATTPGGIGLTTLAVVTQNANRIKALSVDGVSPTAENIASGRYPLFRSVSLVTREKPPRVLSRLLRLIRSQDGRRIVGTHGAMPIR
jgi:phosphate transport system substrate-binding protein